MSRLVKSSTAVAVSFATTVLLTLGGCSKSEDPWKKVEGGNLKVLVAFPPLYAFTKAVAGDDAKVLCLLSGTGPHHYTADARDAQIAQSANLFFSNGLELEKDNFVAKIAGSSANPNLKVVPVAERALPDAKRLSMHDHHGHDHGKDEKHDHEHGDWDPHAWLGIEQAILMVNEIRDQLKKADGANAANYDKRAAEYVKKLEELQAYGTEKLKDKKNRKLIAMHESLAYFCKSFNLKLSDSIMPRPGIEADLKKLADLAVACEKKNIRIIAVEPQYRNSQSAQRLADNLKSNKHELVIVEIHPLETVSSRDELSPDFYLNKMRANIDNLAKDMQ